MAWLGPLACASLGACSVAMCAMHVRTWRQCNQVTLDEREYDFRKRQFYRRLQTSAMLGILALMMGLGFSLSAQRGPLLFLANWSVAAGLTIWILLLATGDLVVTRRHYASLSHRELGPALADRRRAAAQARNSPVDDSPPND